MIESHSRARSTITAIADQLALPPATPDTGHRWWPQSLAKGAAGIALLHIERAHAGLGTWETAHAWLASAVADDISAGPNAGLFFGAPAVAFALHAAADRPGKAADRPGKYEHALQALDNSITAMTHRRLDQAHARIDRGEYPELAEFDLIYGLSGVGAYLLQRDPHSDTLRRILSYLVRLTEPQRVDDQLMPGWWTDHAPFFKTSPDYPGGHGNFGMAHGIAGPLALLALALRRGITVDRHVDAIGRICDWLDDWRQEHDTGPWWPQWITREELRTHRLTQPGPLRPSWCYGTPGLARAQQLAGLATGDTARRLMAEHSLAGCLADPAQLGQIIDTSLCHGWAGLCQTAWRTAQDAHTPAIAAQLPHITDLLTQHGHPGRGEGVGLLEGDAGLALALHTSAHATPPMPGWDACLLIS